MSKWKIYARIIYISDVYVGTLYAWLQGRDGDLHKWAYEIQNYTNKT